MASGIADGQQLPDTWNVTTGDHLLWKARIAGLAHSSPVVWGDTVVVTTAVSARADATFKHGSLSGSGEAPDDRSSQQWKVVALDRRTGAIQWERTAASGVPLDQRHVKSTYASATPVTNGRIIVATFGSMGAHAFDMAGTPLWSVGYGRVNLGAFTDHLERSGHSSGGQRDDGDRNPHLFGANQGAHAVHAVEPRRRNLSRCPIRGVHVV